MEVKKKHSQRSRAIILETAANIIRESGLKALKMSSLAERSKLTRWTIYNHFGDLGGVKKELYNRHDYLTVNLPKIAAFATQTKGAIQVELVAHIITQHFDSLMKDALSREFALAEFMGTDPVVAQMVSSREQRMFKMIRASNVTNASGQQLPLALLFPIILGGITYMAFQYRVSGEVTCFGVTCLEKEFKANLQQFIERLLRAAVIDTDDSSEQQEMVG
ncbi:TetR/AcrR family transcriptional regulator [Olivibacter domesticus]|uniref:Transcriptional regulator, TetR family n=1 Tax=Olivibacter domesticus TaxID=407022 RepID=A0A1H7GI75_OLID1|nr:TetR/AcrR family transcriptional regulator [Olivibacter domesticus]SEK37896.1 transcriptional regulator, TetR family [Olivibacter domesticus]